MLELIALILASLLNGLLGLVVYLKNRSSATSRLFFFATTSFVIWSVVNYISVHPVGLPQLMWVRLVLFFAALLCLSINLTFRVFPNHDFPGPRWLLYITLAATAVTMGLTLTPLVFKDLNVANGQSQPVPGPAIGIFALFVAATLGTALYSIVRKYRLSKGRERAQFRFVFFGIAGTFGLIVLTNFVLVVLFQMTFLVPFGASFTLLFSGSFAYAIVRHRLLNIRSLVARSAAYVLLLVALAGLYAAGIYGFSTLFFANSSISSVQLIANVGLAMVLAFTFQPLRRFFERLTDRIFYRDRYDTQEVLNVLGKTLASELLLEPLLQNTLREICQNLRISVGQFMIFNDHNRIYKVAHFGPLPRKLMVAPTTVKLRQAMLVADELEGGERKEIMEEHGVRVSVMLRTRDEFVGFLFLGDKLSGDIYSSQDLGLLEILSSELAVAITNAKAYEEIAQFNLTLQDKVNHATARLRVANRNLKALDKAKDEFISMASHQLRTPLTTIKGYLSMIIEGDAGKVTPQQKEFLDYAFGGAERMVALISDLLNVSRLSAGRFVIEKAPCDIDAVVADEVRQLQSHAVAKQLKLEYTSPKHKLPMIELDEGKTRQVIMNFIDNAIYYTKQGSVSVTLDKDNDNVYLRVKDTGIGVPEEAKKKLFTKFYRAENAQAARPDGTGLGLYLAKRVVEDQGGDLIFESSEGKGSTFGFSLPLKAVKKEIAKPEPSGTAHRVVVDVKPAAKV